jgi:HAD superfamily hydrolase (TIGR01509 family)
MTVKAIFWDNDGVLVDTERLYFAATRQTLATAGINLTKEMYVKFNLIQGKGAWHLAKENGISAHEIEQMRDARNSLYGKLLGQQTNVIEGAGEVLGALYGKYIMGIVTSSRKDHFEIIHRYSGMLKYFDFLLTGDDYTKFKPDPEPYLLAVEKSGCKKEECIAIEDSERGLTSAKSAGIRCYIIPTELTRDGNFSGADKVLKSIKEIMTELN